MNKKPITVYWAPASHVLSAYGERNMLFSDPFNQLESLMANKNRDSGKKSFFACPAFSEKSKNTYGFPCPMDSSYTYDFSVPGSGYINPDNPNEPYMNIEVPRPPSINEKPQITFGLEYIFFADESLEASFTPPYFEEPGYLKYAAVAPGNFNVGEWLRPFPLEMTLWRNQGKLEFKENETLFYVEFLTDRPIILKRFKPTPELLAYGLSAAYSSTSLKSRIPLLERYEKFKNTRMRDLVMKEILPNVL